MTDRTELTTVDAVRENRSWLFTASDARGDEEEVVLVPCGGGVEAWVNRCTHEAQRLDRGFGAAMRDGQIVCPKHGSMFDACSGHCDNGEAADTTLVSVAVTVEDGAVYLAADDYAFVHAGAADSEERRSSGSRRSQTSGDDEGPSSSSHLSF